MEEQQEFKLETFELQTGHYLSLQHALSAAMTRCVIWCYAGTEDKYDVLQLFNFAKDFDQEHPIKDRSFYMVSAEGAIGVSPGMEYLTKWMFIPDMDEASIEKLQSDIRQLEAEEQARKEAEEKARREAEEKAKQAAAAAPATAVFHAKFCPLCGTPYKSENANFCVNCGAPRK